MKKNNSIFLMIFFFIFLECILFSCCQNKEGLYEFIKESLEDYILNGIKPDSINFEANTVSNQAEIYTYDDFLFYFEIVRKINQEKTETKNPTESLGNFDFFQNDTILLNKIVSENTTPVPLYLSLYREAELIIQENVANGLCIMDKVFQFPGKYTLTVTFQTNQIIQEACFQINIQNK